MMPKCYHKRLQATFDVVTIDKVERTVKVVKMIVNNGTDYPEEITEVYPLDDVEILNYSDQVDNESRPIMEGNIISYGDGLVCSGRVVHARVIDAYGYPYETWYAEELMNWNTTGKRYNFTEADPKLLHIIDTHGR